MQWDFSTFEVTLNSVLAAIEAGIFEETLRYLNLVILLVAMRNFKYRMIFAIVISSILFSLSHLGNLGISTFLIKFDLEPLCSVWVLHQLCTWLQLRVGYSICNALYNFLWYSEQGHKRYSQSSK